MNIHLEKLLERYPQLDPCISQIQDAFDLLCNCYEKDGIVYICGNGGSAADAQHIVAELMKSFSIPRKISSAMRERLNDEYLAKRLEGALRAISLTGAGSLATAFANDVDPDLVFAQQIFGYGRSGDVLWGISTSGNSRNVLYALRTARAKDIKTLGLTGKSGGEMAALCDVCICVPESEAHKVQELHLPIYHVLCRMLEAEFFGQSD